MNPLITFHACDLLGRMDARLGKIMVGYVRTVPGARFALAQHCCTLPCDDDKPLRSASSVTVAKRRLILRVADRFDACALPETAAIATILREEAETMEMAA